MKPRISITLLTVLCGLLLVVLPVGLVLFLGITSVTNNTRSLMTKQAQNLIESIERGIELRLQPVQDQAAFIAQRLDQEPLTKERLRELDEFMFGTLAATTQVTGVVVVSVDGMSRRWRRTPKEVATEDWSARPEIQQWLKDVADRDSGGWGAPVFTKRLNRTILLYDYPLRDGSGALRAVVGLAVPLVDLSNHISSLTKSTGLTPFVLYGRDKVLAHPDLKHSVPLGGATEDPLKTLDEFNDPVLNRLWTPDDGELAILSGMRGLKAVGSFIEARKSFFVSLYRENDRYGDVPWVVGAHIDTDVYGGTERNRVIRAIIAGIVIFVLSTLAAIYAARRIARPIKQIATAAHLVEQSRFDDAGNLPESWVAEYDDASRTFNTMVKDLKEREVIRETLGRFVPEEVARTLLNEGGVLEPISATATILYADIANFTSLTEQLGPDRTVTMLNSYFTTVVTILQRHGGVATQFQGDAVLATFNVPISNDRHGTNAVQAALEISRATQTQAFSDQKIGIRIGLNTGNVVAGAVGADGRQSYTVHGDSVNLAARLEQENKRFGTRILLSQATADIAESDAFVFKEMGQLEVRGRSGLVTVLTVGES